MPLQTARSSKYELQPPSLSLKLNHNLKKPLLEPNFRALSSLLDKRIQKVNPHNRSLHQKDSNQLLKREFMAEEQKQYHKQIGANDKVGFTYNPIFQRFIESVGNKQFNSSQRQRINSQQAQISIMISEPIHLNRTHSQTKPNLRPKNDFKSIMKVLQPYQEQLRALKQDRCAKLASISTVSEQSTEIHRQYNEIRLRLQQVQISLLSLQQSVQTVSNKSPVKISNTQSQSVFHQRSKLHLQLAARIQLINKKRQNDQISVLERKKTELIKERTNLGLEIERAKEIRQCLQNEIQKIDSSLEKLNDEVEQFFRNLLRVYVPEQTGIIWVVKQMKKRGYKIDGTDLPACLDRLAKQFIMQTVQLGPSKSNLKPHKRAVTQLEAMQGAEYQPLSIRIAPKTSRSFKQITRQRMPKAIYDGTKEIIGSWLANKQYAPRINLKIPSKSAAKQDTEDSHINYHPFDSLAINAPPTAREQQMLKRKYNQVKAKDKYQKMNSLLFGSKNNRILVKTKHNS